MKAFRYIDPEDRRWLEENLICLSCGNDTYFNIDLRISHILGSEPNGISIEMDRKMIDNVTNSIAENALHMIDNSSLKGKPIFTCANCDDDTSIEYESRVTEICYSNACGGCWYCGYATEEYVLDCCSSCIKSRNGKIEEEDCEILCEYSDNSLLESREHYNISFDKLKRDLGYFH